MIQSDFSQDPTATQSVLRTDDQTFSQPTVDPSVVPLGQIDPLLQAQLSSSASNNFDDSRPVPSTAALLTQAIAQTPTPSGQSSVPSGSKEQASILVREVGVELPPGVQQAEVEKSAEISPEVEKFIEEIKQHEQQIPQEIVINAQQQAVPSTTHLIAKPVVVLPLTQQELAEAKKEPLDSSRRWLAEWTEKIMKVFSGSFIYKETN